EMVSRPLSPFGYRIRSIWTNTSKGSVRPLNRYARMSVPRASAGPVVASLRPASTALRSALSIWIVGDPASPGPDGVASATGAVGVAADGGPEHPASRPESSNAGPAPGRLQRGWRRVVVMETLGLDPRASPLLIRQMTGKTRIRNGPKA